MKPTLLGATLAMAALVSFPLQAQVGPDRVLNAGREPQNATSRM